MKQVVITGGTRGIGFGLAKSFAREGFRVSLSGRMQSGADTAVERIKTETGNQQIHGFTCDNRSEEDLMQLWEAALALGPVDIWINNAGAGHASELYAELDSQTILSVLRSNLEGSMLATKIVLKGMSAQGFGAIYNMEGFGSDGRMMKGMSVYGTSKYALRYFTKSISREYSEGPVLIGSISPGMVVTELLTGNIDPGSESGKQALKIFNILADEVSTVCPWIVKKVMSNKRNGVHIAWLNGFKITGRFVMNIFKKRRLSSLPKTS